MSVTQNHITSKFISMNLSKVKFGVGNGIFGYNSFEILCKSCIKNFLGPSSLAICLLYYIGLSHIILNS